MSKKNKHLLLSLLAVLTIFLTSIETVHAQDSGGKATTSDVESIRETSSGGVTYSDGTTYDPNAELPSVSIDQATDWADRKGQDATNFLQVGGQWIAIIVFVISAIITMFGAIAGKVSKGLIGVLISIIMYTGITFAPTLIDFFSQWLAS